jgi:hypothetical protein
MRLRNAKGFTGENSMPQTLTGLFDNYGDAERAVSELESAGVPNDDISIVANNAHGRHSDGRANDGDDDAGEDAGKGAGIGAAVGGVGGLLAGLGLLAIPGLGPVVAAGWLVSTLAGAAGGAAIGAAAGGLVGALTHAGVPENDAHVYAESVRRGGTLVTARVDDAMLPAASAILAKEKTVDIASRRSAYEQEGWTRFDETASPYTADQVESERLRYHQI